MARMTAEQKAQQRAEVEQLVQRQAGNLDPAKLKKIVEMILKVLALFA